MWRNERNKTAGRFSLTNGELRFGNTPVRGMPDGSLMAGNTRMSFKFDDAGKPAYFDARSNDDTIHFTAQAEWQPTTAELTAFAGHWHSEEAEAKIKIVVEADKAFAEFASGRRVQLRPLYKDGFSDGSGQLFWFDRDSSGKVVGMHVGEGRMRDMPFLPLR